MLYIDCSAELDSALHPESSLTKRKGQTKIFPGDRLVHFTGAHSLYMQAAHSLISIFTVEDAVLSKNAGLTVLHAQVIMLMPFPFLFVQLSVNVSSYSISSSPTHLVNRR